MSICWLALSTECPATKPLVTKERAAQVSALALNPNPSPSPSPSPNPNANANQKVRTAP